MTATSKPPTVDPMTTTVTTDLTIKATATHSFFDHDAPAIPKAYPTARDTTLVRIQAYASMDAAGVVSPVRFAVRARYRLKDGSLAQVVSYPPSGAIAAAPVEVRNDLEAAVLATLARVTVKP